MVRPSMDNVVYQTFESIVSINSSDDTMAAGPPKSLVLVLDVFHRGGLQKVWSLGGPSVAGRAATTSLYV